MERNFFTENKKKGYGQIGLTALMAAGLFSVLYLIKGMYPFGDGSVMMTDMYSQYVPLLYRFYDVVSGEKNLFLDFRVSGGANLYVDTINEVVNPFNYILFLFGRDMIYKAVNVVLLCYVTAAAAAANYFLLKICPDQKKWNPVLSLCYALSGYAAYNFQIIKWMYLPVVFPFFMLALLRLLREKKGGLYAVLLAYQLVLSIQMGFMTLLFTLFGSGIYLLVCVEKEERPGRILRLGLYTAAGVLLSGPVLLPNIKILLDSSRAGENLSYFAVMKQHGLDDLFERLFQIVHPVLAGIGLWLGAGRKKAKKNRSATAGFWLYLNAFLWVTVVFQPANLLWHMGSYVCFPVRYAYMVLLCEIALLKQLLTEREAQQAIENDGIERMQQGRSKSVEGRCAVVLLCTAAVSITLKWEDRLTQAFSSLAISRVCRTETFVCCGILLLLVFAAFLAMYGKRYAKILLTVVTLVSCLCLNLFLFLPRNYGVRQENEAAYEKMTQQAQKDSAVMEREKEETGLPLNGALVNGRSTLTGYFPTAGKQFKKTMEELGYLVPWVATQWVGGTEISDTILTMGLLLDETVAEPVLESDSVLARQRKMAVLVTGQDVLECFAGSDLGLAEGENRTLFVEGRQTLYLDCGMPAGNILIWVNGEQIEVPEAASAYSPNRILELGTFENEEVIIGVTDGSGNQIPLENMEFAALDQNRWETALEQLKGAAKQSASADAQNWILDREQLSILESAGKIAVHFNEVQGNRTVFLPFAALDGWKCERNGEIVDIAPILSGFMGITTVAGENEIVFSFTPPGLWTGIWLMGAGITLLLAVFIGERLWARSVVKKAETKSASQQPKTENTARAGRAISGFYYAVLAAAVLVIYVVPFLGLAAYLVRKVLGL
ncbi:MAG: YfhO family protein [Lachnospiraceae bacterium]|nr:YfhO family protein [Lachnospiraceae bacterium]